MEFNNHDTHQVTFIIFLRSMRQEKDRVKEKNGGEQKEPENSKPNWLQFEATNLLVQVHDLLAEQANRYFDSLSLTDIKGFVPG